MISYNIHVRIDENANIRQLAEVLHAAAHATLTHEQVTPPAGLTVVLGDDEQLQALNRQFMGHDEPADVLSFPSDDDDIDSDEDRRYLGDIVISLQRAQAQATAGGHPTAAELQLLAVHGALHLLGYGHATAAERATMWAVQATILTVLGAPISGPPLEQY